MRRWMTVSSVWPKLGPVVFLQRGSRKDNDGHVWEHLKGTAWFLRDTSTIVRIYKWCTIVVNRTLLTKYYFKTETLMTIKLKHSWQTITLMTNYNTDNKL